IDPKALLNGTIIGQVGRSGLRRCRFLRHKAGPPILQIEQEVSSMWKEFKEFAIKGNVIDLAIGVIIGTAFGKIVTSLVNDLLMPVFGLISGGIDLNGMAYTYGETEIKYGAFLQSILDFLIISVSIFFFVKAISKLKSKKEEQKEEKKEEPPKPSNEEVLLAEI